MITYAAVTALAFASAAWLGIAVVVVAVIRVGAKRLYRVVAHQHGARVTAVGG